MRWRRLPDRLRHHAGRRLRRAQRVVSRGSGMTETLRNQAPVVDFVILSNIIVDDLMLASGEERLGALGGAATYAAAGARLWSARVGLVSGVGEDFARGPRAWFESNGFDLEGVTTRHPLTPRSWVRYMADGEHVE